MNTEVKRTLRAYLEHRPFFMSFIRPHEAGFFARVRPALRKPLLDFGCGDGFFARTVFGARRIDTGIDLSSNPRIREARDSRAYRAVVTYDGTRLPFPDRSYGTVVSNCVLEHIPRIPPALNELYRVLKPGGCAALTVMESAWERHLAGSLLGGQPYVRFMRGRQEHHSLHSHRQWRTLFLRAGFAIEEEWGYLKPRNARILDLAHYLSLPSLISRRLTGKWTFPQPAGMIDLSMRIVEPVLTADETDPGEACARAFLLRKPK